MKLYCELSHRHACRQPSSSAAHYLMLKSWEMTHTARASVMCHRCEQPLRVVRPAHRLGDLRWQVSWLAGRCLSSSLPSFPVADADEGSPLTVAGAATAAAETDSRPVFPLASPVQPGEPARCQNSARERKRQAERWRPARICGGLLRTRYNTGAKTPVVALALQNMTRRLVIVARTGLRALG